MWLNPNADPLPEDPTALRALAKTIEQFLAESVERDEDVAQHELGDEERRRRHQQVVELTPSVEELQTAWAKVHVSPSAEKSPNGGRRGKASKDTDRTSHAIKSLEKQADALLASIRELGIHGKGWSRDSLLGQDQPWQRLVESLSLQRRPIHARLTRSASIKLNKELVQYGVAELQPVKKPELLIHLDDTDTAHRAIHGASANPIVVGRAKLEAARAGAEELRQRVQSAIDKSATVSVDPVLLPSPPRQKALSICSNERRWRIEEEIEAAFEKGVDVVQRLGDILHKEYAYIEKSLPNWRYNREEANAFQEAASELDFSFKTAFFGRHDGVGDLEAFADSALAKVYAASSANSQRALFGMDQPPGKSDELAEEDRNHAAKLDHVILWILVKASRPLIHKEIETEITASWGWYCEPVKSKTIANHFSGSTFLQSNTMKSPTRGRIPSKAGAEWVQRNPCPTPP